MSIAQPQRLFIISLCLLMLATAVVLSTPTPAAADNCEPTELVVRVVDPSYEEPGEESKKPHCTALQKHVYTPGNCSDPMSCTSYSSIYSMCRYYTGACYW